ncbi:hypothetical protein GEO60473_27450 [Geobacter sp. 60473]|nr:hypothetical protein GEO60473_27450 [Geobacter sp. 60473]
MRELRDRLSSHYAGAFISEIPVEIEGQGSLEDVTPDLRDRPTRLHHESNQSKGNSNGYARKDSEGETYDGIRRDWASTWHEGYLAQTQNHPEED